MFVAEDTGQDISGDVADDADADAGADANDVSPDSDAAPDGSGQDTGADADEVPPPTFAVDESMTLQNATFPGLDGETDRPVARVEDAEGRGAEFVANELILATDDTEQLAALLERWSGEVVQEFTPDTEAIPDMPAVYLVRIDAPTTELDALAADLAAIDAQGTGEHRVSSEQGLALIATAAADAADGVPVGLNWIAQGDARFLDRESREAPSANGIDGYQPNAWTWPFLSADAPQRFGVPEAWRLMELAGRLDERVRVAILDMGFSIGGDLPGGALISNVPFVTGAAVDGQRNLLGCGSGGCPWHGTNAASAAFGRPDDGNGSVGPAGPIAEPIYVFTLYDFFTSITAVAAARAAGARVMSMSYGADVPGVLGFTVWPFEIATRVVRASGALLFASAGNSGRNVDGEDCFLGICWEHTWHTPCENAGVICVGGLGWNVTVREGGNSNFGRRDVDIYGPYTIWTGPDPGQPDNRANWISGTSFSSPYVAGAAALIWAADPTQTADQVERRMMDTARTDSADREVGRYVAVLDAVRDALNPLGFFPPFLEITSPADGSTFAAGLPGVGLAGIAEDFEDGPLTINWSSDRAGALGTGASLSVSTLTAGRHVITASATDSRRMTTTRSVTITITNEPPTVGISAPEAGSRFFVGETVTFIGTSFDRNEPGFVLPDDNMRWSSSRDGALGTGHRLETSAMTIGSHTVTLTGTDTSGRSDAETVSVWIDPPPVDSPPRVSISSPADNSEFVWTGYDDATGHWYYQITLRGSATDTEDGSLSGASLVWTTDQTTYQPARLGTGAVLSTRLYGACEGVTHTIRLTATDSGGNARSQVIRVRLYTLC